MDSILGLGRAPGEGNGNPLQCTYNPWTEEPGRLQSMGSKKLDMTEGLNTHILQMIFLTQGSNPDIPHCRQIVYHPSNQESPYDNMQRVKQEHFSGKLGSSII